MGFSSQRIPQETESMELCSACGKCTVLSASFDNLFMTSRKESPGTSDSGVSWFERQVICQEKQEPPLECKM